MRIVALLALMPVLVLGVAGCGGSDSETTASKGSERTAGAQEATGGGTADAPEAEPGEPIIVVHNGEPVGGVQELEYSAGEEIRFRVRSDVADEVHVHGYDVMEDVAAGGSVSFDFPAEIEGIFEVELEEKQEQIAELRVNP
jgi:hypothetical protein